MQPSDSSQHPSQTEVSERSYQKTWRAWALYDVANSAFYLSIVTAIFPLFYQALYVRAHNPGAEALTAEATQTLKREAGTGLAFAAAIAMAIVAVLGPVLGAMADRCGGKKKFLAVFAGIGSLASALMAMVGENHPQLALVLYIIGTIGVAGSIVFYDALLLAFARKDDLDRISSLGFALGYAGSLVIFLLNLVWVLQPAWFGLADSMSGMRLSFVSVGVWWMAFTIPLLRRVPEPPVEPTKPGDGNVLAASFGQLFRTLKDLGGRKELLLFLVAFWLYSDGIGTIIKLSSSFGDQLGISAQNILLALILCQLIGIPCALAFGRLARTTGAKAMILVGLTAYGGICVVGYFMQEAWHFYLLAALVGLVQGGTQALSRSLFASIIPKAKAGEYFGFFSTMEKFAGVIGPVLLGWFWAGSDNPRPGILALVIFFIVGAALLAKVDIASARHKAEEGA